jgi:hypothetical protein
MSQGSDNEISKCNQLSARVSVQSIITQFERELILI